MDGPKTSQSMWFDKNKCHNQIPHAILCIYVEYQLPVITLLEMANSDHLFDPRELETDVLMGNRSGYKAILKNNS